MKVLYTTGDAIWLAENGKSFELPSYRAQQYLETIDRIAANKAWKTTGRGAQFMGVAESQLPQEEIRPQFRGLALYRDEFLYTLQLDASGGMYRRDFAEKPSPEGHIVSGNDVRLGSICARGDDVAACLLYPNGQSHIGLYQLPSSACTEITGGDSVESAPSWTPDGRCILFSSCGIGRGDRGIAYSPNVIMQYNVNSERMDTILEDEKFDFLAPKLDEQDNLWYIRQPYQLGEERAGFGEIFLDILLFPFRILKAVGGFLNVFSMLFGGESLQKNSQRSRDVKSKQRSEKDLFFEGNLIHAEENQKENQRSGDEHPGILPRNRVLIRRSPDGNEEIIARSVLDYTLTPEGVLWSNGTHILLRGADGKDTVVTKTRLASKMQYLADC